MRGVLRLPRLFYHLSLFTRCKPLASLCSKLEKITRDFIWNSTVDQHRTSLVSWKEMCRPHKFGGCGLKKLSSQNQALLTKIGFALISRPDQLWVQVLRAKYKWSPEGRVPPNVRNCSHLWRSLTKLWKDIKLGVKWEVGDGSSIKFWQDHWVGDLGPLKNLSLSEIPSVEQATSKKTDARLSFRAGVFLLDCLLERSPYRIK